MKTVSELAKELKVTPQAIYSGSTESIVNNWHIALKQDAPGKER
jgi:DNA-binding XRE family transcriptional regulator